MRYILLFVAAVSLTAGVLIVLGFVRGNIVIYRGSLFLSWIMSTDSTGFDSETVSYEIPLKPWVVALLVGATVVLATGLIALVSIWRTRSTESNMTVTLPDADESGIAPSESEDP